MYISVPDLDVLAHTLIQPILSPDIKFHVMRMMFDGQVDEYDFHYFGWNQPFLTSYLADLGFENIERLDSFGLFNNTSDYKLYGFPISVNMIAVKSD